MKRFVYCLMAMVVASAMPMYRANAIPVRCVRE